MARAGFIVETASLARVQAQEGSDSSGTVEEIEKKSRARTGGSSQDVRKDILTGLKTGWRTP